MEWDSRFIYSSVRTEPFSSQKYKDYDVNTNSACQEK